MNKSMDILIVLVSLSLIFSLISVVILFQNQIGFRFGKTESTPLVNPPTASPSISIEVSFTESSRQEIGNNTKITLTVNVTYLNGNSINITYSQFYLALYAPRMGNQLPIGNVYPLENGKFTLGISNKTEIFELLFEFPTMSFNGMDNAITGYTLGYKGAAKIHWANQ
jgi:hypothetical protein